MYYSSETMRARRQWNKIFEALEEKVTLEFFSQKYCSKINMSYFFRHKTAEKSHQQISTLRHFKGKFFKQKEIIPDKNLNVHEKMQRIRNIKWVRIKSSSFYY